MAEKKSASKAKSKSTKKPEAASGFALPEVLDITCSSNFYNELTKYVSDKKPEKLEFNAEKLEKITTPGVQILISAAKAHGGNLLLTNLSDNMKKVFIDLGFETQLKEWV